MVDGRHTEPGQREGRLNRDQSVRDPDGQPGRHGRHPAIRTPTLVLWGGADAFVPADNAQAIAAALPDSELVILEGVGHFSHDDDPEGYAEALSDWFARLAARPAACPCNAPSWSGMSAA